jgi:hypothetical protein
MEKVFLTGIYRSGTTLLDKILNSHPQVSIFSQPFSPLYFNMKKLFLKKKGIEREYPFSPDFMEQAHSEEFLHFLDTYIITSRDLDVLFEDIKNYTGQMTSGVEKFRTKVREGKFLEVFDSLIKLLDHHSIGTQYAGVKEILCEEFIPYFTGQRIKSMIIVRDPRDIICSLNFGKGKEYTGDMRPLLYSLRLWRKSVAYAICYRNEQNFLSIRYEDLVLQTESTLKKVTSFLEIPSFQSKEYSVPLKDQNDKLWKGNSSHGMYSHINAGSIGKYKELLDDASIQYIENVCYPEMKYLDYPFKHEHHDINQISAYKEPFLTGRKNFSPGFSSDAENISMEIRRFNSLSERKLLSKEEHRQLFLFPEVYAELKKMM